MEYYLTPELEAKFRKLFPVTFNEQMMKLFGIGFSTLQRFKRELGLTKNRDTILKKHATQIKHICEANGWYESIKGKAPSEAAREGYRKKVASGWHPLKSLKAKHPKKYKRLMKEKSEQRMAVIAKDKRLINLGLTPHTMLHLPQCGYTKSQLSRRCSALKRGYYLGDRTEDSGERYTIFYDKHTQRAPIFEKNCIADGFDFRPVGKVARVDTGRTRDYCAFYDIAPSY